MKKNAIRKRFDFSKIPATIQIPNLIEVQKRSYERFLQMDRLPSERDDADPECRSLVAEEPVHSRHHRSSVIWGLSAR